MAVGRKELIAALALAVAFYWLLGPGSKQILTKDDVLSGIGVKPQLHDAAANMLPDKPTIIKVVDGVYVAVGYSAGNSILVEGSDGVVIVDTAESVEAAAEILSEFRKITKKPVKAIVYTHNHLDHVAGAPAFIEDPDNPPEIWAHHSLKPLILQGMFVGPKTYRGIVHQFGLQLGQHLVSFFRLRMDVSRPALPLFPTRYVHDEETIEIPGLKLSLLHIPGETPDQVEVWLPEKRVLMAGDNIYSCYPNIYAVRGAPPRSSIVWAEAIRRMRDLQPEHLVLSHGLPVSGGQTVNDLLTVYMLGIRYVHDQTVRMINKGIHPDEIARRIQLPPSLVSHPYMQECYGMTSWSAKAVYEEYVGWFSGDPVDLQPLTPRERAERVVRLVGEKKLLAEATEALEREEFQWALEVSTMILRIDPDNRQAKSARLEALRGLAGQQVNPTARNFFMTTALDDYDLVDWKVDQSKVIETVDVSVLLNLMRFKLKAEEVDGVNLTTVIHFTDTKESFRLRILYSVLDVTQIKSSSSSSDDKDTSDDDDDDDANVYDLKIETTTSVWREIVSKKRSSAAAIATGDVTVEGGILKLREFFSYFQQ